MRNLFLILFFSVSFYGCTDKSTDFADDWCSCMKRSGLSNALNGPADFGEFDMKSPCFDDLGKEMYDLMKGMTHDQRARFMKSFSKALLETDCADIVFNLLPYDKMMEELGRKYERKDIDFTFDGFWNRTEICQCIDLDRMAADDITIEKCDRLTIEFEERYNAADAQGKEEIMKIIEECRNK